MIKIYNFIKNLNFYKILIAIFTTLTVYFAFKSKKTELDANTSKTEKIALERDIALKEADRQNTVISETIKANNEVNTVQNKINDINTETNNKVNEINNKVVNIDMTKPFKFIIVFCMFSFLFGCTTTKIEYVVVKPSLPTLSNYNVPDRPVVYFYPSEDLLCADRTSIIVLQKYVDTLEVTIEGYKKQIEEYTTYKINYEGSMEQ